MYIPSLVWLSRYIGFTYGMGGMYQQFVHTCMAGTKLFSWLLVVNNIVLWNLHAY